MRGRIDVDVDDRQAKSNIRAMMRRGEDFKSVFRWARRELERANIANFASQGAASGQPWMPLDDQYARWKLEHYGPLPILIRTGTLAESLSRLRGRPNEIDRTKAVFGTDVKYAKYHQHGTYKMPARKIVFASPVFVKMLASQAAHHVVFGSLSSLSIPTAILKEGF